MAFVYMFLNLNNEVIYVGHTNNMISRMRSHFSINGHIDEECYKETAEVHYSEMKSLNDARVYEIYYISKLRPKYNKIFTEGGDTFLTLPEITFEIYNTKMMLEEKELELMMKTKQLLLDKIDVNLKEMEMRLSWLKSSTVDLDNLNKNNFKTLKARAEKTNNIIEANVDFLEDKVREIYLELQN